MRQGRSLEELSFPLEEEGNCLEAWQEFPRRRHHPRKKSGRKALLNPQLDQHLRHSRALSKHAMLWARQMSIPLEPRQIHAQDIHLLRARVDSIGLF
jgi:hypothetical protein